MLRSNAILTFAIELSFLASAIGNVYPSPASGNLHSASLMRRMLTFVDVDEDSSDT